MPSHRVEGGAVSCRGTVSQPSRAAAQSWRSSWVWSMPRWRPWFIVTVRPRHGPGPWGKGGPIEMARHGCGMPRWTIGLVRAEMGEGRPRPIVTARPWRADDRDECRRLTQVHDKSRIIPVATDSDLVKSSSDECRRLTQVRAKEQALKEEDGDDEIVFSDE